VECTLYVGIDTAGGDEERLQSTVLPEVRALSTSSALHSYAHRARQKVLQNRRDSSSRSPNHQPVRNDPFQLGDSQLGEELGE
jgi:hypothetical protein